MCLCWYTASRITHRNAEVDTYNIVVLRFLMSFTFLVSKDNRRLHTLYTMLLDVNK